MKETCGGDGEQRQKRGKENLKRGKGQIIPEPLQTLFHGKKKDFEEKRHDLIYILKDHATKCPSLCQLLAVCVFYFHSLEYYMAI